MSRIAARFAALKAEGRGALMPFLEAGDPDLATSLEILRGMPGAGADLIEIGCPFTDPMADGPTVQRAAIRALDHGARMTTTLQMVRDFRVDDSATPVVLMGYLNPILSYGPERFCVDAAAAGVDGLIVVDLPSEEADLLLPLATAQGIDIIRLVAPTTDDARLPLVLDGSSGFVYYRHAHGQRGRVAGRDPAHPPRDRPADCHRFWRANPGPGRQRGACGRWCSGGIGVDRHIGRQPG